MLGREGRRRLTPRRSSFRTIALLTLIPVFGLLAVLLWTFIAQNVRLPAMAKKAAKKAKLVQVAPRGKIVLILDDVGFDHQPVDEAMTIDPNVNFSVLPNAARATQVATLLHLRGFEVLCHLPMEPEHFPRVSPGSGAVLTTMSNDEIARTTVANVEAVPFARDGGPARDGVCPRRVAGRHVLHRLAHDAGIGCRCSGARDERARRITKYFSRRRGKRRRRSPSTARPCARSRAARHRHRHRPHVPCHRARVESRRAPVEAGGIPVRARESGGAIKSSECRVLR